MIEHDPLEVRRIDGMLADELGGIADEDRTLFEAIGRSTVGAPHERVIERDHVEQAAQPWVDVLVRMLRSDVRVRVRIDGAGAPALINALQAGGIHAQRLDIGQPDPASGIRITRL